MAPILKEIIPEIEHATHFIRNTNLLVSVGKQVYTEDEYFWAGPEFFDVFTVAGVFKNFSSASHVHFEVVFPFDRYFQLTGNDPKSWSSNYTYSYVKLYPQTDMKQVNEKLVTLEKELTVYDEASSSILASV